jgi:uncharacterized protein YsxB (DUF464 family)
VAYQKDVCTVSGVAIRCEVRRNKIVNQAIEGCDRFYEHGFHKICAAFRKVASATIGAATAAIQSRQKTELPALNIFRLRLKRR